MPLDHAHSVLKISSICQLRREGKVNELYCFETWGQQALDFLEAFVGEPAFIVCNSVGGDDLKGKCCDLAWLRYRPMSSHVKALAH